MFSKAFDVFRDTSRIVLNDKFIGDEGATDLSQFLTSHGRVESLEIKSNDISAEGFVRVFEALTKNPRIRQIVIEYNRLGDNEQTNWEDSLASLIGQSQYLERLNISNNKVSGRSFSQLLFAICESRSLKLLELRFNSITSDEIDQLVNELHRSKNQTLLFVELTGNKIKRQSINDLENYLKQNRRNNPISKDKLLMTGGFYDKFSEQQNRSSEYRNNSIDDLSKQNVIRHLEGMLNQNRKNTTEMKIRLEEQLNQLLKQDQLDANELSQLDNRCNELTIQNRNLKFQYDRLMTENVQAERIQEHKRRVHQEKIKEANKDLESLQQRFDDVQTRMTKEYEMKMREIPRTWEDKIRTVEDTIRDIELQINGVDKQIQRCIEKKERSKVQLMEQEAHLKMRVEQQQTLKYDMKMKALETKLQELEEAREKLLKNNQDILYQVEETEQKNQRQITQLEEELQNLKYEEEDLREKNQDLMRRNEELKSSIKTKEVNIENLEQEINRINEEIAVKKGYHREQVDRFLADHDHERHTHQKRKKEQLERLTGLETALRNCKFEHVKLRQEYIALVQRLQINVNVGVQDLFTQNHLY